MTQLQYFRSVAVEGNVTSVAEKNFVSQTAVSNAISRLERELNINLFDRHGKKLILNEYGATYLKYVNAACDILQRGQSELENILHKSQQFTMHISLGSTILMGQAICRFATLHPEIKIVQSEINLEKVELERKDNKFRLYVTGENDLDEYFDHEVVMEDKTVVFVPNTHPFSKNREMYLSDFANEEFINPPRQSGFYKHCMNMYRTAGFNPKILCECEYAMREFFLAHGNGVTLGSMHAASYGLYKDVAKPIRLLDDYATRRIAVFRSKLQPNLPIEIELIDFLKMYFGEKYANQ